MKQTNSKNCSTKATKKSATAKRSSDCSNCGSSK